MNRSDLNHPPTAVGGIETALGDDGYRKDLNHPPTAVGGIENALGDDGYRKDLNDPPTAVGRIQVQNGFRNLSAFQASKPISIDT